MEVLHGSVAWKYIRTRLERQFFIEVKGGAGKKVFKEEMRKISLLIYGEINAHTYGVMFSYLLF